MNIISPDERVLAGVAGNLTFRNLDANGDLAAVSGTLTVGVDRADGTEVLASGTSTSTSETGVYTVALTAAQLADLDILTATWTDDGDSSAHVTYHEVVGGHFFTVAEARAFDSMLADASKYSDADMRDARLAVEWECEQICWLAFRPRFRRVTLHGTDDRVIIVPDNALRSVTAATIDGTALTAAQLAALTLAEDRELWRPSGAVWDGGTHNIVIEYEHGWDAPPPDLKRAAMLRMRSTLNSPPAGISERATRIRSDAGSVFDLAQPDQYETGIPMVDNVYRRYSLRPGPDAGGQPKSRSLDMDPQRNSLYHQEAFR